MKKRFRYFLGWISRLWSSAFRCWIIQHILGISGVVLF